VEYTAVNLHQLAKLDVAEATPELFIEKGMLRKGDYVKILGYGELTRKVAVSAHAVSKTAEAAITAAGGSVTILPKPFKVRPAAQGNQFTNR
jgi:large subunit ribosomal protein L15